MPPTNRAMLEVKNLKVYFPVRRGLFGGARQLVKAVDDVSFRIDPAETLGLVGESGCGKTTLGRAIVKLIEPTAGSIWLEGEDIAKLTGAELRARRRKFQMIFQDPYNSLDPRMTVGEIIAEALEIHRLAPGRVERQKRIEALLEAVGLDRGHAQRYPHEFSGGQRQRIGIARALAVEPKLIVCDEPVSALDVSVQAQIINLLQDLQREHGVAYLFVAHDLAVVEHISRRVMVMYLGRIVELGPAQAVVQTPKHPYTQALVSAVPQIDPSTRRGRIVLTGEIPSPIDPPGGCPFHPRCPLAQPLCQTDRPAWREIVPGHWASCHFAK
ncbi:MAG TPA: dipeptide ABC transporter ATP-binding protein [Candidatus Saccharimonadales bacterium]|nr:dipeptide ABC transporter ATP-binding protein [Candidatus Saccharimonadales bacterium]